MSVTTRQFLLSLVVALTLVHSPAGAATVTFDFEGLQSGGLCGFGGGTQMTTLTMTKNGLVATVTRPNSTFGICQTSGMVGFGSRSLDPFAAANSNTAFVVTFSTPLTSVSVDMGDFGGDRDFLQLEALSAAGAVIATATDSIPATPACNPGQCVFVDRTLTVSATGIVSIRMIGGSGSPNFNSVIYDNITATFPSPTVAITATAPTASEAGPKPGVFSVSRTGSTTAPLTVLYTVGGTATGGSDYEALAGSVTIPAGSAAANILVTPINDTLAEASETVIVTLGADSSYVIGTPGAATVTIVSDDPPTVTIAATTPTATEVGPKPGVFTVTRTGPTTAALTVSYTVGGTATAGSDYQALAGSVTLAVGSATANIQVTPVNDTLAEADETVAVKLNPSAAYLIGTPGDATVTIVSDDLPTVTVAATTPTATEAGPTAGVFTVTRTGPTTAALTVSYSVGGSATAGSDYQSLSGTVTVAAGSATATITVTPIDDALAEANETVAVKLNPSAAYLTGTPGDATVTIVSNDPPTVTIVATTPTASETGPTAGVFTVSRTGPTTASLVVSYAVSGAATPASDYQSLSGTVTVPAGSATATITVTPIDDALAEADETVVVTLNADAAYLVGTPGAATVTIVSNDPPTVTIVATTPTAGEVGPTAGAFTVTRTGPTTAALTVRYAVAGAATAGSDYQSLPGTVTVPAGSATAVMPVTPIDDTLIEPDETVVVTLSPDAAYFVGTPGAATVTITSDDLPSVSIAATTPTATEAGPTAGAFTVTRTGPTTAALIVRYTVAGSATAGSDYQSLPGTVTVPAGNATAVIPVTPVDDTLIEPDETVVVTLGADPTYVVGAPGAATVTIVSDDLPAVTIAATTPTASEVGPTAGAFTVTRTGPTTAALTVSYGVGGTATAGSDYQTLAGTVTVPAGSATATITVTPIDDALAEADETVVVTLSGSPAYLVGTPGAATVTIISDDLPTVTIAATTPTATEAGPTAGAFTVTRTGPTTAALTVSYGVGGTATAGSDHQSLSGTVTVPVGSATATITVTPLDDALAEADETVVVTLSSNAAYLVGAPGAATVTIVSNDLPTVTIVTTTPTASEAGSTAGAFTVTRTGPTTAALTVRYAVTGSATPGSDYQSLPGTVTVPAGSITVQIPVTPVDDALIEPDETVVVTLSPDAAYFVGTPGAATVTITSDDLPSVSIAATTPAATEAGPTAGAFTVTRTGPTTAALIVRYTVAGSATAGSDYQSLPGTVTVPAGSATVLIPVTPVDDTLIEPDETVVVTLGADPTYVVGPPGTATVTITSDDLPTATIAATTPTATEAGPTAGVFTVARTGLTTAPLTVLYVVSGSASPGSDYQTLSGSVTILAGSATAAIPVTPLDDALTEADETVVVTLGPDPAYVVGTPGTDTVTIVSDDLPGVTITATTPTAREAGPTAGAFSIARTGPTTTPLTVRYSVAGTATASVDYQTLAGSVTLSAGAASATVAVMPIDDLLVEPDETVVLTLSPDPAYAIGAPASATVTIVSNDQPLADADPPFALIGNFLDGTISVIGATEPGDPTAVAVTAIIRIPGAPVAGLATNPVRTEAYVAALDAAGAPVLTVIGTDPPAALVDIPLSVFEPSGVVVNPAGTRAYVAGGLVDNLVSVVDLDTRTEITTVALLPLGAGPVGLAMHPTQPRLYVANENAGTIAVINTATNTVLTTITLTPCPVACAPHQAVVTPNGSRLYVTDSAADVVWVINTASNTIVTRVAGVLFPEGLAAHPDGSRVYVANVDAEGRGRLTQIATATNTVTESAMVGTGPLGVAVHPSGDSVYVVNFGDDTVTVATTEDLTDQTVLAVGGAPVTLGSFITPAPATLQFSSGNYSVTEGAGVAVNATITVVRSGALGATLTVPFTTSSGTAGAGIDYTETVRTLTFLPNVTSQTAQVPVLPDSLAEAPETVTLTLGTPAGVAVLGAVDTAVLTIADVGSGTVQFSAPTLLVTEGTPEAVVTVTRAGPRVNAVTVPYAATPLTAVADRDFVAVSGTLTFPPDVGSQTFSVPIIDDTQALGERRVALALGPPTGNAGLGSPATATLVITDNDAGGVLRFPAATATVSENAGSITLTVQRTGGLASGVFVDFTIADGTAIVGQDYVGLSGTLTFGAGNTSATIMIPIIADLVAEGAETFRVTLGNPRGGATLGTPAAVTVTINDVAGALKFTAPTASVSETAGSVTLTVQRTGGAGGGVTVDFTIEDLSASSGSDYTAPASSTLTFAAGATSATITIPIVNDGIAEGNETFRVVLINPQGGATLGTPSVATVTILDTGSVVQFSASSYAVKEGTPASITLLRSGTLGTPTTVTFRAEPGTAGDFAPFSSTVTFAAGQASRSVMVATGNNAVVQGNRSVILGLEGTLVGSRSSAVLTVVEDEQGGVIRFNAAIYSVAETAPSVVLTLTRALSAPGGTLASAVSVDFTTMNGSALSGLDFTALAGTISFNTGETTKTITIPILNDALVEGSETFSVVLSNPTGGASLGTPALATVTITDAEDRGGVLQFSAAATPVSEGAGSVTLTILRSGGTAGGVLVDFTLVDVTATTGLDYTPPLATTLTFGAGNLSATITIPIVADDLSEGSETFRVVLSNPRGGASLGTVSVATVTITDDESAVQFGAAAYAVKEGTSASITLLRSGALGTPATVIFRAVPDTATSFAPFSTTVTFAAGQPSRSVPLPTPGDTVVNGNRTVLLSLDTPIGTQLGSQASALLTLLDDDQGGVIKFSAATYSVAETAPSITLTLTRALGAPGGILAGAVSVDFTTMNGSALSGFDYTAVAGTVSFNTGETSKTITIPILNDALVEGSETFSVVLSNPTGGASLGTPALATVTITDAEDRGGVLQFSAAASTVSEGAGRVTLTVLRSGGTAGGVLVDFTLVDVTATTGLDYTPPLATTLTFGAGNLSATITIPIVADDLSEGSETFRVVLSNPRGGASLGTVSVATVTITDDESAVQFNAAAYAVKEGTAASITVLRSGALGTPASVTFRAVPDTATSFAPFSTTVTFAAGQASRSVPLPTPGDTVVNGNRTVQLSLDTPVGTQLGSQASALLTLLDDDQGGVIRFSAATYSVAETAPSVTLTLTRALGAPGGTLASAVSVDFTTMNGSALSGFDYTALAGTISFNAGETTKTIGVRILGDTLPEGPETFTVALSNPTGGASLGTPALATVTITDDDVGGLVAFGAATVRIDEGAGTTGIRVVRTGNSGHPGTVDYSIVAGTAGAGVDYIAPPSGTLTFAIGQTEAFIAVTVLQDSLLESNETFSLTLSSPRGGLRMGTPAATVVTIVDDDAIVEFSGRFQGNMPEIVRRGALQTRVTVDYQMTDGTAIGGVDYLPLAGTLTFTPGVASQPIPLRILNDDAAEAPETFTITLSNPTPADSTQLGPNAVRALTITDNDFGGVVRFGAAAYAASEGGDVTITVIRQGGLSASLTVGWTVSGGTATAGPDFSPAAGVVTFAPNVATATFTLTILADGNAEPAETVQLSLGVPAGGAAEVGAPATTVVTIAAD